MKCKGYMHKVYVHITCWQSAQNLLLLSSGKNVLGKGGFGAVYKASVRERAVAVKVFLQSVASMGNTTPNQLIRQEVCM